jgi:hypothetical protein
MQRIPRHMPTILPAAVLTLALLGAPTAPFAQSPAPAPPQASDQTQTPAQPQPAAAGQPQPAAQTPAREGNTWDWRDHQPTEGQVQQNEQAAGIAPTQSQQDSAAATVDQLYRQLLNKPRN